jgi:putative transposase
MGTKRHLLVDARGVPLSLVVTGANRHDVTQLEIVLDCLIVERPDVCLLRPQGLCADKGYDYPSARQAIAERCYTPHVRSRGEERAERAANPGYRARRWVVEACHSWLNRFRKILVRFEKTDASYEALLRLACAIIVWRRVSPIYG